MKNAAALTIPALGNARKARAPDAMTLAAPEETHQVPTPGSRGTSSPLPAPPLPNFRAPPRARPSPRRAPRRPHQPARPQALPGTEAGARERRAELVGGSGSLGGDRLSTRPRQLPASFLPEPRWAPGPPAPSPGAAPACARASAPPPALVAPRWLPLAAGAWSPGRVGGWRLSRGPRGVWRRPGPESLWDAAESRVLSGQPRALATPAAWREVEDEIGVGSGAASRGTRDLLPPQRPLGWGSAWRSAPGERTLVSNP